MNMIRSCLLQYSYSFKPENNGYSIYMNNTFYDHTPKVNGLFNLDRSDTHVHNIDAKRCKVVGERSISKNFLRSCKIYLGDA